MPDNTTLDPGVDGDAIRTLLRGTVKTPVSLLDQGGTGAESLVDATHPLRVSIVGAGGGVLTSLPVDVATLPPAEALPAGTNNIGDVDVLTLPPLPAGTNTIGKVDIVSFPAGAGGELSVVSGGRTVTVDASFTRPGDTSAYAPGDVVNNSTSAGTVLTFTNVVRKAGGSGVILNALLIDGASQATKLDCELFLFDTTLTADNDNSPFTPTDAELGTCVGVIDFGASPFLGDATVGAGGNCVYSAGGLNLPIVAVGGQSLFGVLVARNAYTPTNAETFRVRLSVLQD